ncbi:Unsaturated rhamnogalacturonyl hydrolase YteR [Lasiodiplodia theobromae]|uniref:Unsaturated rhamnogalacturonyl hydrolase YteR n=1 Tax=Lasiodiplodia theobromae TaxID=45133 RepID=A0A5N5D337_9PEZI|nr:Unsaturated rhamnogalacturonyl hydrolase YteR [Lasiodiplodia theobromae]
MHLFAGPMTAVAGATNYSTWMATSIISRGQGVLSGEGDSSQLLQAGFTQKAFRRWLELYPNDPDAELIGSYIKESTDSITSAVSDAAATIDTWSLDRLSSGNNLITLYQESNNETYRTAFEALRQSIDLQPRNSEGGLWYYTYPNWSYLDGMYSLAPFYTLYTALFDAANSSAVPDDMVRQLDLLWQHCRLNSSSALLVHGYDDSRTAVWADPVTGASPHVWGRSLGWYAMALVDTLELLSRYYHDDGDYTSAAANGGKKEGPQQHLMMQFAELAAAVVRAADGASGAWWQVMDQPGRAGNYIESSGSAMFVYALLKGARLGYLSESSPASTLVTAATEEKNGGGAHGSAWTHVATRAYEYLVETFVVNHGNGTLGYNGTVSVCSLNSTASYEYYVGRPILYNSVLGSAAFVLASVEYEALGAGSGK